MSYRRRTINRKHYYVDGTPPFEMSHKWKGWTRMNSQNLTDECTLNFQTNDTNRHSMAKRGTPTPNSFPKASVTASLWRRERAPSVSGRGTRDRPETLPYGSAAERESRVGLVRGAMGVQAGTSSAVLWQALRSRRWEMGELRACRADGGRGRERLGEGSLRIRRGFERGRVVMRWAKDTRRARLKMTRICFSILPMQMSLAHEE